MVGPVVKSYCSSLSLSVFLSFDAMGAWCLLRLRHMTENKAICTQEFMDSPDTKRIRLSNETRVNTGSVTLHSVCVLFCDVMCVREKNQCNTIECCSVGGHTLSS